MYLYCELIAGLTYVTMEPCYLMARKVTMIWWSLLVGGVVYVTLQPIIGMKWQLPLPQVLYPFNYNYVSKKNVCEIILANLNKYFFFV